MALLHICTVGGSPEPIVASIAQCRPDRVLFVTSPDSQKMVGPIVTAIAASGHTLGAGAWDTPGISDPQDIALCVRGMRDGLEAEVRRWQARGVDHEVSVDFTGGTKCMSAALALVARPWVGVRFVYVGGTARTNAGLGIVVAGSEKVLERANPWDSLGYQAVEEASLLFDQGALAAAARLMEQARDASTSAAARRECATLAQCFAAYASWDAFQHRDALRGLEQVSKNGNDLRHAFGPRRAEKLLAEILLHTTFLNNLLDAGPASMALVCDLVANARRRAATGAWDDAVARLYRAVEAYAQYVLLQEYGIDTAHVPAEQLPASWLEGRRPTRQGGGYPLGLQEAYALLAARDHPAGRRFKELQLDAAESPLTVRNASILAHGFSPVSKQTYGLLEGQTELLLAMQSGDEGLPRFPRIAEDLGAQDA